MKKDLNFEIKEMSNMNDKRESKIKIKQTWNKEKEYQTIKNGEKIKKY